MNAHRTKARMCVHVAIGKSRKPYGGLGNFRPLRNGPSAREHDGIRSRAVSPNCLSSYLAFHIVQPPRCGGTHKKPRPRKMQLVTKPSKAL